MRTIETLLSIRCITVSKLGDQSESLLQVQSGVGDDSLKGAVLILGELVMIGRDDVGFERLMEARARNAGAWQHDDYKLLMRYTDLNIESGDVAIIAEQEEINMYPERFMTE